MCCRRPPWQQTGCYLSWSLFLHGLHTTCQVSGHGPCITRNVILIMPGPCSKKPTHQQQYLATARSAVTFQLRASGLLPFTPVDSTQQTHSTNQVLGLPGFVTLYLLYC